MDEVELVSRDQGSESSDTETEHLLSPVRVRRPPAMSFLARCCSWRSWCCRTRPSQPRTVWLGRPTIAAFPPNLIRNQKYSLITFIPLVLFNQFKFFLNLYFLVMACSQFIPQLRIGFLYTYWGPLAFVIAVTMGREAIDDIRRWRRDREVNSARYSRLTERGWVGVRASELRVGDMVTVGKGVRAPADLVLLRTTETSGACFIRTDQLDGETDWKLRLAVGSTQRLAEDSDLCDTQSSVYAERPQKDIHSFIGKLSSPEGEESLAVENTIWCGAVVASGTATGLVVYTGVECRAAMNNSQPRSKVGLIDQELNSITKVLFLATVLLSVIMVVLKGFDGPWYIYMFRFLLLFSYLIPISLRVNLDIGKIFYSWAIGRDSEIPGCQARSTTIPEELGRVSYLLSDKTGTLTMNQMVFKKLHLGTVAYTDETFDEVATVVAGEWRDGRRADRGAGRPGGAERLADAVLALALCHNVTPVYEAGPGEEDQGEAPEVDQAGGKLTYQASSPDEVALVEWAGGAGLSLAARTFTEITLTAPAGTTLAFTILQVFPFTSETKRMGIIVRDKASGKIVLYMKGADTVMANIVQYNDWLAEEVDNMAREGLRTLVVASKILTEEQYLDFEQRYQAARLSVVNRAAQVAAVVESLQRDMALLCVTGVEDRLQNNVRQTLEMLRNAGVKVWMLTGDKLETATCIAKSSKLVARTQDIYTFKEVSGRSEAHQELNSFRRRQDTALVIRGDSLEVCLEYYELELVELLAAAPAVVCCRCSPQQKANVVRLIERHTGRRAAAVGDGGNDVSMIQAASVGVGIEGKEGKQASLASDFSLSQFSHIGRLLLVHGRNSYKRSASLSQFVIHRGLIITTMQAIFSAVFYFSSVSLYQGFLMVGYATIYTMLPVFSLVLDKDVTANIAITYPELYKELMKGRSLSYKTFFIWVLISIYQGGVIIFGALLLFEEEFIHIVAISFTALILTELTMVALTVRTWHPFMLLAELVSILIYFLSLIILRDWFDSDFIQSPEFVWKTLLITAVSCLPLYLIKFLRKRFSPPSYQKLQ